jgi:starch synthase (maltosyl-transferring)
MSPLRICHVGRTASNDPDWTVLERALELGFDTILAVDDGGGNGSVSAMAEACSVRGLSLFLDLDAYELDLAHPLVRQYPEKFSIRRHADPGIVVDPRHLPEAKGCARVQPDEDLEPLAAWWSDVVTRGADNGVTGFRIIKPGRLGKTFTGALIERAQHDVVFIADTPGETRDRVAALSEAGFDYCLSSLPWWDGRASWFAEETETLSRIAPVIAQVESPAKLPPVSSRQRCGRLAIAALSGSGLLMPIQFAEPAADGETFVDLAKAIRGVNDFLASHGMADGVLRSLTGPGAALTILLRADAADARIATHALVAFINPDPILSVTPQAELLSVLGEFNRLKPVEGIGNARGADEKLVPGEVRLFWAEQSVPITVSRSASREVASAVKSPRVVVENISPVVDGGRFAAKGIVGELAMIEADIYTDGHPLIAAELLYKGEGERNWQRARMLLKENDRWRATMPLDRLGRHSFCVEAWIDVYGGFARDLIKKRDAGLDLPLEIREGQQLLQKAREQAQAGLAEGLAAVLGGFDGLSPADRVGLLLAPETIELMRRADERQFKARSETYTIEVERTAARFASWYELFPRSASNDPARHGTFRDVIAHLPYVRDMGFDVLYLPPIHPIGRTNRKGKNNALKAAAGDVGSVYAIGSSEGGHDAIHPDLGSLEDFRTLVNAAHEHGLEIALDFAIQASPDHPWLKEHPGWFDWRPDGSIKYAENPPKKYEDIVNVDFYAQDAVPGLWAALRDVVLFWIEQGVKIFRVDNPHTKPFPFWQWLIADIRGSHPDVIFLSEAFTRPKVMQHLAKLGFSQSYTYFIWRNTKQELTEYLTELSTPPVSEFFRPNFFINTPDINPYFLQTSGRAGFLIRAALATTLSGLWGMYSGYEVCEAAPLPGREEYLDSEKYEIRARDWNAPGNIIPDIAQLNRLRKAEPALQSHLNLTFYKAFNDNILYYGKRAPGHGDIILVAVSLDPRSPQEADFEAPLWEFGLADHAALECEDLLRGGHKLWRGKIQHMRLTPGAPYAIWRVTPAKEV